MKIQKTFRLLFLMVLLTGLAWPTGAAVAAASITFDTVTVDLWPEYDRPGVTVFREMDLAADTALPQDLSLRIPANAEVLSLSNGGEQPLAWEHAADGGRQTLQFKTSAPRIQLTFYDPAVIKQDQLRSYAFVWLSDYPVNALTFTFQIPYCAGALVTDPPMSRADTSSQNCVYYILEAGQVEAGEAFPVSFQYAKDLSNSAYPALSVYPAEKIDDFTTGRTATPFSVVIWLAAVALAILVGLYYWWFRRKTVGRRPALSETWGSITRKNRPPFATNAAAAPARGIHSAATAARNCAA